MAVKFFEIESVGRVRITKRTNMRNLRLSIASDGEIRVSIPAWASYQHGLDFVESKADWIMANRPAKADPIADGHQVGKAHHIVFSSGAVDAPTARLAGTEIKVVRPTGMATNHPAVQKAAAKASIRALRHQAEALLPKRLAALAEQYSFDYASVSVKQLKGRWGSCDQNRDIVLNLFLMQLPWHLIDYVLVHELVHTKHLNHSADFWAEFERCLPRAKAHRKAVRQYKPQLQTRDRLPTVA